MKKIILSLVMVLMCGNAWADDTCMDIAIEANNFLVQLMINNYSYDEALNLIWTQEDTITRNVQIAAAKMMYYSANTNDERTNELLMNLSFNYYIGICRIGNIDLWAKAEEIRR